MKKIFFLSLLLLAFLLIGVNSSSAQEKNEVRLYFFHTSTCPICKAEDKFLNKIKERYPNLEIVDILLDGNKENYNIFGKVTERYKLNGGVPVTVIGEDVIYGYNNEMGIGRKIIKRIDECSEVACNSFLDKEFGLNSIKGATETKNESKSDSQHDGHKTIQVFNKEVCLEDGGSLCFLGGLLGLADGVNPCMFSVLTFLLVYLMGIGSSKKALKAGIAFIVTTFLFYLFFMYGLIQVISVLKIASEVKIIIAIFALLAGLVMIKDFFFYGKWFSFEIPKKVKPTLERLTKKGTVASAIVLALLASLVELPCTSGIPLAYVSILSTRDVFSFGYLLVYNFFFVLPLMIIVFGTIFFWKKVEKVEEWKEKSKKYMRLVAGVLLVFLSVAIYLNWF